MRWLLNLIYMTLLVAVSPWLFWAAWRHGKYREGWSEKFWGAVPVRQGDDDCVWFHAVSLGEVNLLETLLREVTCRRPGLICYISTTTLTGYQAACRRYPQHTVCYCPLDFSWAVANAVRRIRPHLLVLAELELWPNLITTVHQSDARVAIVNGRLSPHSFQGYRRVRPFVRRLLAKIDLIAVQTEQYATRFAALGGSVDRIVVTGSLKFDGAPTDRDNRKTHELARLAGVRADDIVWLAGSTFPPEEQMLIPVFQRLAEEYPRLRLILVPRHPERFDEVAELLERSGQPFVRRTQLSADSPSTERLVLVDSIGELAAWWGMAHIGFVGGSFGKRGGQNMIEPAGYGVALCFGPRTENFRDAVQEMCRADAARVVAGADELQRFVRRCLDEPQEASEQGGRARQLVLKNQGAASRTAEKLLSRLSGCGFQPQ